MTLSEIKKLVQDKLGCNAEVNIAMPAIPTSWVVVPPDNTGDLVGTLGDIVASAMTTDYSDEKSIPTPIGMGTLVDVTRFIEELDMFAISMDGEDPRFMVSTEDGLKVFSLQQFAEYICKSSGVLGVGIPPREYKVAIEAILDDDEEEGNTELYELVNTLRVSADEEDIAELANLAEVAAKARSIIWDGKIPFAVYGEEDNVITVSENFPAFINEYEEILEAIIAQVEMDDMADVMVGLFEQIESVIASGDVINMMENIPEMVEAIYEVVSEPIAVQAVDQLNLYFN